MYIINNDLRMTLTFLRQGQYMSPMHLNGENVKMSFIRNTLQEIGSRTKY